MMLPLAGILAVSTLALAETPRCDSEAMAKLLEPYTHPPKGFVAKPDAYRSPLIFADGRKVTNAEEWGKRRAELLKTWHDLMGPWPEVLTLPKLEVLDRKPGDGFEQQKVRVQIAADQTADGYLLVPKGTGPFPAVLVVYYEPETSTGQNPKQTLRDFGLQLAKRGFVTLSIGTPGGNAWKPERGRAVCQPLSYHAYVAANCWQVLANRKDVDAKRIGVVGHSYGGKWSLFAAALWDKFAAVATSDPGIVFDEKRSNVNYWEPWYLGFDPMQSRKPGIPTEANPRTGAYKIMREKGHDLHEIHSLIAPRPLLVSGGSEDPVERWNALNHTVVVNSLLGFEKRVLMSNRPAHSPTEESNAVIYGFFEHFLMPAR